MNDPNFMATDGSIVVESGAEGTNTTIISVPNCDMSVTILDTELPWLINTLGERLRDLISDAARAQDAALLDRWNAATSDEISRNAQQINALRLSQLTADGEVMT